MSKQEETTVPPPARRSHPVIRALRNVFDAIDKHTAVLGHLFRMEERSATRVEDVAVSIAALSKDINDPETGMRPRLVRIDATLELILHELQNTLQHRLTPLEAEVEKLRNAEAKRISGTPTVQ